MASKKVDWRFNLSVYFGLLRKQIPLAVATLFLVAVVELAAVAQNYLFKIVIDDSTSFSAGSLAHAVFMQRLWTVALVFACLSLALVVGKWLFIHFLNRLETSMIMDLKRTFFTHIINLSHSFHASHRTGSLISRLLRGGGAVEGMTDTLAMSLAPILIQLVAVAIAIPQFDVLTGVVAVGTGFVFVGYALCINSRQQPHQVDTNAAEDSEKAFVSDSFTNIESIKYFGKETTMSSKYANVANTTTRKTLLNWDYWRWLDSGHYAIRGVGLFLVIAIPLYRLLQGTMSVGTLVFIYTTVGLLFGQLYSLNWNIRRFFGVMSDFQSLFPYLKIEQEVKDKKNAKDLVIKQGRVVFDNVTFAYKNRRVISKVDLVFEPGTKVAIVGPSGGGKTTITKLLYRLYDVNEGSITIDGQDIRDVKQESLRGSMAIVPQDSVLFNDTLFNNIAFSNRKASRKDVVRAMKFAQLDRLVARLPKKERTRVGERGIKLSGGERQRVGIARAILADKRILVLDEATSALDSQTEHEIQADLRELMKGRTTIIIAHRLSTILSADVIAVMEKGTVVQLGKHDELVEQPGIYKRLWNLQKGGFIK